MRCTCDNSHHFLSRRSSRHAVPQDDTWGRGVTRCCCLSMSVVSFPGDVSTAFHSAQHDTWVCVAPCAFGCGCPTILSFRAIAWESSRQAHFAPLDCHVATFVAPRNDKEESDCCALYFRQFTSFPFQEMFRLRFTPLNMTRRGCVARYAFGCGCPTILSFRATAWESSRQAHFAPLDCHVATFVAPRNDKEESEYFTCLSGGV